MSARDKLYAYAGTPSVLPESMLDEALDTYRAEVVAERDAEIMRWLGKKAREYRATGSPQHALQADTIELMASKISRGAVRPDNTRLPAGGAPDFFQPGHAYTHRDGSTFRCVAVTTHPDGGERVALGWHTDTADWTFVAVRNINHWNHEYDGVQPPAEVGEGR
ncbi:hypothetical protein ACIQCF_07480 [Streptomyces sp. NPDC088353]|uniref:hypothetical protein n=1 Tax=Streptomyces sp. NPDC088353 TaxID=3365855 RepID=UPI00380141CD